MTTFKATCSKMVMMKRSPTIVGNKSICQDVSDLSKSHNQLSS